MTTTVDTSSGSFALNGTDQTLATTTGAGVFEAQIGLQNMADGDVVEMWWEQKIVTSSTATVVGSRVTRSNGGQGTITINALTAPFALELHIELTGTNFNIEFSVNKIS